MNARIAVIAVALALLGLGVWAMWPARTAAVSVTVTNATARPLEWVALDHARGGARIDYLAPGTSRTIHFTDRASNAFRLRARFADGAKVSGTGGGAPGGVFHAVVGDSGVVAVPVN